MAAGEAARLLIANLSGVPARPTVQRSAFCIWLTSDPSSQETQRMEIGVFIPIGSSGWLASTTSPQYKPTFELNPDR